MSLTAVLNEINSLKPYATENVDEGNPETMGARRGRQRQAKDQIKRLREQYIQDLMRSSVFIVTSGSASDEFAQVATEKFGCFAVDAEAFYKDLADRIPESLIGRETPSSLFDILGRHLEDLANDMQVIGYPQLIYKSEYGNTIGTKKDLVQLIKTAINDQVGGEMAGIHAVRSIADVAIEKNHAATVTPVILKTNDEKLVLQLAEALERLTPRVFVAVAGKSSKALKAVATAAVKEANEETVEQALTTVRSSLKK